MSIRSGILRSEAMKKVVASETVDLVSKLFESVRAHSVLFCRSALSAPWGFSVSAREILTYHLVVRGRGWLNVDGETPIAIDTGDLVILAHGDRHTVRDASDTDTVPLEDLLATHPLDEHGNLNIAGAGPETILVCGGIELEDSRFNPLIPLLPKVLHVDSGEEPWLAMLTEALDRESRSARPARNALVNHLGCLLLVAALRRVLDGDERTLMAATALGDSRIMRASSLMIQSPELDWDVNELAERAGMSRNGFTRLFSQRVGQSPSEYLRHCRMAKAVSLLRDERRALEAVSSAVGYASIAAFSRAFKSVVGVTPGEFRSKEVSQSKPIDLNETELS